MSRALSPSFAAVCGELDRRQRITLGFERIEALLKALGNPERALRIVQVVGTNGKGTTAVALAAALEAAGHAAGAYLSPHVISYTERVMVRGSYVSEEEFAAGMGEAIRVADENGIEASQFELLTAGALAMFRGADLEWAVLEAGLGARHDATTAAGSAAVVLTNVALDHTEYLGDTVEEIAREKLAGLRTGSTLLLGTDDPVVVEAAREAAARTKSRIVEVGSGGSDAAFKGLAPYAAHDARVGLRAAGVLLGRELETGERRRALGVVCGALPGRFETHEVGGVPVVVDGGHNPAGVEAALSAVREVYGDRPLGVVFGVLRDKDIGSMLTALKGRVHTLVLTRPASGRAAEPGWIAREFEPRDLGGRRARVVPETGEALRKAVEEMRGVDGVVLVTGSLYVGAAVLEGLREN